MLHMQHVGQHVETLLGGLTLVDDNGIVEVAALDEVGLQQRLDVAHKDKSAGTGDFIGIFFHIVEGGELRTDELRLERAHRRDGEFLVGQDGDDRTGVLILHLDLLADDVIVLGSVLLFDAHLTDLLDIFDGRAVEDGELRTIDLNQTVVDAEGIEGRKTMLNGRALGIALSEHCAALGVDDILCDGIDHRLTFEVDTLNLVARILRGWIERDRQVQTCVQPLAEQGETAFQCFLFHIYFFKFSISRCKAAI